MKQVARGFRVGNGVRYAVAPGSLYARRRGTVVRASPSEGRSLVEWSNGERTWVADMNLEHTMKGRQKSTHNPPLGYKRLTARIYYRRRKGYAIHVISFEPPQLTSPQIGNKLARLEPPGPWEASRKRWMKMRGSLGREGWMERTFYFAGTKW